MKKLRFIAETDGHGVVERVWRFGPDDRTAHPVSLSFHDPAELAEAEFHGASEAAIRQWLARPRGPAGCPAASPGAHPTQGEPRGGTGVRSTRAARDIPCCLGAG